MNATRNIAMLAGLMALLAAGANSASGKSAGGWAVVDANGNLIRGLNATSASLNGTGSYQVYFNNNISKCVYVADIGSSAGDFQIGAGEAQTVAGNGVAKNSVVIIVNDTSGNDADKPIMVIVQC